MSETPQASNRGTFESPTLASKLGPTTFGADFKQRIQRGKQAVCVFTGTVTEVGFKRMPDGSEYEPLIGAFYGIDANTGEVFTASVLYLPAGIHELIAEPFMQGRVVKRLAVGEGASVRDMSKVERSVPVAPLDFALELLILPASNKSGYTYQARALTDFMRRNVVQTLLKSAHLSSLPGAVQKALPAPLPEGADPVTGEILPPAEKQEPEKVTAKTK